MKRPTILTCLVCMFISLSLVITCTPSSTTAKTITVKWADFSPAKTSRTDAIKWLGDEMAKRTGGAVKFEYYWAQALVKSRNIPEAIRDGLAQAGMIFPPYYPSKFPLASVGTLLMQAKDIERAPAVVAEFLTTYGPVKAELEKWNLKALYCSPASAPTLFSNKPVKSLADFKGLKIRALGFNGLVYKPLGATTVNLPLPEMYEALQRGTVDGEQCGLHVWWRYGHHEVAKYWLNNELGQLGMSIHCISKDVWNKLTPEQQKILDQLSKEAYQRVLKSVLSEEKNIYKEAKNLGVTINSLSPAEHKKWIKLIGSSISDTWLRSMKKKGLTQAPEALKSYRALLKKRGILIEW